MDICYMMMSRKRPKENGKLVRLMRLHQIWRLFLTGKKRTENVESKFKFINFCFRIFFSCGQENKILFLHQEKIVKLPSCAKNDLCDFNSIVQYYKESLNNCNFDEMCDISLKPKN